MNQLRILIAALALAAAPASGQTAIGFLGGATRSTVSDDSGYPQDASVAIAVGASLDISKGDRGLLVLSSLAQKGASATEAGVTAHLRFNYVEISMLPRFTVADRVRFIAGPSFAIKTGCEISVEGDGETIDFGCDEADEGEVRGFDLGITGGIGVYLTPPVHGIALTVDLVYTHGLMNYVADDTVEGVKHRAFGLLAGIAIPVG